MELLQFVTAGNVDDGKSTLIGRLLYDIHGILDDQLLAIETASKKRGDDYLNLALLTDGLRAEREQGITIDVAYRYFTTLRRKFIIADCPGHIQYTRNMVTGSSRANLAIVLIDARKGIVEQTKRHCFVASLLQIPHLVICINKMDLVDYSEARFLEIKQEFSHFAKKLEIHDVTLIPVSAIHGDNVVHLSRKTPWYQGRSLLGHLEEVYIASDFNCIDFRFPVQNIIRPFSKELHDYRGYAGMIASGTVRVNDRITVLPSGFQSRVQSIERAGVSQSSATASNSVVIRLEDELDVSRGDMIVRSNNQPQVSQDIELILCWMDTQALNPQARYLLRHTTSEAQLVIKDILYKFDINTLGKIKKFESIELNDFAKIKIRVSKPLIYDKYKINKTTGGVIFINEQTGATCAAGMII